MSNKLEWDLFYPDSKEPPARWQISLISPIECAYLCPSCGKKWSVLRNQLEEFDYCPKCGTKLAQAEV